MKVGEVLFSKVARGQMLFVQRSKGSSQTDVGVDSDGAVFIRVVIRPFAELMAAVWNRVNRDLSSCSNSLGDCGAGSILVDLNRSAFIVFNIQRQSVARYFLLGF